MRLLSRLFGRGPEPAGSHAPPSAKVSGPAHQGPADLEGIFPKTWDERVALAVASPDNAMIPRVAQAGVVRDGCMTMHNGLLVGIESYYGAELMRLVERNKGVHEPQEERAFEEVLAWMKPGASMLELGAYWSFYSMCFALRVGRDSARCVMVEPDKANLEHGRRNFDINNLLKPMGDRATFLNAFVGGADGPGDGDVPVLTVDTLVRRAGIQRLDILHADIQGAELDMLKGAAGLFARRAVDYVFVSTHSMDLHGACLARLRAFDYEIIAQADPKASYSYDGIIVARRRELTGLGPVAVSQCPFPRPKFPVP